jgi:hypothetical protein
MPSSTSPLYDNHVERGIASGDPNPHSGFSADCCRDLLRSDRHRDRWRRYAGLFGGTPRGHAECNDDGLEKCTHHAIDSDQTHVLDFESRSPRRRATIDPLS